jgi:hypothetical protein
MSLCSKVVSLGEWRNWYTRMLEVHMPQGLEVQVLSRPPKEDWNITSGLFYYERGK